MSHPRIEDLDIRDVWRALGGGPLRGNRGRAFWRDGDGPNVSLNPNKGVWYDQARGEGGGIVHLVQAALGCDGKTARVWLHDNFGVSIGLEHTPEERREWARRMEKARKIAAILAARRQSELEKVQCKERAALEEFHRLDKLAHDNQDIDVLVTAITKWQEVEELTRLRDLLNDTDGPGLLQVFRSLDQEAA